MTLVPSAGFAADTPMQKPLNAFWKRITGTLSTVLLVIVHRWSSPPSQAASTIWLPRT